MTEQKGKTMELHKDFDAGDGDWLEAFGYAGAEGRCGWGAPCRVEGATCPVDAFDTTDVAEVIGCELGCNGEANWQIAGRLNDGRWFYLSAGCDYTDWDCQAGGNAWVADDRESLVQFGIPGNMRDVWGLS